MQSTERFIEAFQRREAEDIRYYYKFSRNTSQHTFNGISHRKGSSVYLAGFSDSGITLFSAKWENGQFDILKNHTKIPVSFLKNGILVDLLLPYLNPGKEYNCIYLDSIKESRWLPMEANLGENAGFFVLDHDCKAWCGLNGEKMYYRAEITEEKEGFPTVIEITNYQYGYVAEMKLLESSEGD